MNQETNQNQNIVLVVEDDKFLLTLLVEKLKREGMFVIEAENGQEAMIKMKSNPRPHVVLLDLLLPIVDGFDVLKRMQDDPELKRIPVVVLTNLSGEEDAKRARKLGVKEYLVKAYFTPDEIVDKIRAVLREEYL